MTVYHLLLVAKGKLPKYSLCRTKSLLLCLLTTATLPWPLFQETLVSHLSFTTLYDPIVFYSETVASAHLAILAVSVSLPAGFTSWRLKASPWLPGDGCITQVSVVYFTFLHNKSSTAQEKSKPSVGALTLCPREPLWVCFLACIFLSQYVYFLLHQKHFLFIKWRTRLPARYSLGLFVLQWLVWALSCRIWMGHVVPWVTWLLTGMSFCGVMQVKSCFQWLF